MNSVWLSILQTENPLMNSTPVWCGFSCIHLPFFFSFLLYSRLVFVSSTNAHLTELSHFGLLLFYLFFLLLLSSLCVHRQINGAQPATQRMHNNNSGARKKNKQTQKERKIALLLRARENILFTDSTVLFIGSEKYCKHTNAHINTLTLQMREQEHITNHVLSLNEYYVICITCNIVAANH